MSAKCKYSAKFWPLVYSSQISMSGDNFKAFLIENFEDGETVYMDLVGGADYDASSNPTFTPQEINTRTSILEKENLSVRGYYEGKESNYQKMTRKFRTDVVSKSVYDRVQEKMIDANAVVAGKHTVLNIALAKHKIELLNVLRTYMKVEPISYRTNMTNEAFSKAINDTLAQYAQYTIGKDVENNPLYTNSLDAFVVIKNYDTLLKNYAPFITKTPEYSRTKQQGINMYVYKGPEVKQFTGWGDQKVTDIAAQMSDLSKILLDYLPEVNDANQAIEGTSITVGGFSSVMTTLKRAVLYNPDPIFQEIRSEYRKGAQIDMVRVIDAYLDWARNANVKSDHLTYLTGKLRAIKKYIYKSKMGQSIKDMFTATFFKTVPVSYRSYRTNRDGSLYSSNLKEQFVNNQLFRLSDVVKARIYTLSKDQSAKNQLFEKYNVEISDGVINLTSKIGEESQTFAIKTTWKQSDKEGLSKYEFASVGNLDDTFLEQTVYDFLSYILPDDYTSIGLQLNTGDKTWTPLQDFAPLLAAVILGANKDGRIELDKLGQAILSAYDDNLQKVAKITSVVYGSDTTNVIKNAEGNNLPLYQLKSLAYDFLTLKGDHKQTLNDYVNRTGRSRRSILEGNLLMNSNIIREPVVRSDISMNGKSKTSAQLNVGEVLRLSIVYDFYHNFIRPVSETGEKLLYYQNTTFADKNTHFLIPCSADSDFVVDGKSYTLSKLIDRAFKGDSSDFQHVFWKSRQIKIQNLVANLLDDYEEAFGQEFTTLDEVNKYLIDNKVTLNDLQIAFTKAGIDLFENIHYYKPVWKNGVQNIQINETIYNWNKIFNDEAATKQRLDKEKRKFIKNLFDGGFKLDFSQDSVLENFGTKFGESWKKGNKAILVKVYNKSGSEIKSPKYDGSDFTNPENKIVIHPMLEAYFMSDILLSNEYNSIMIGEVYAHANKNKDGVDLEEYSTFSEANRLIAQYKRAVILGATHHPFLQNMKEGVAEEIKVAVVSDSNVSLQNIVGEINGKAEPMDGSGLSSPYQAMLENNSLLDARVGWDKKTIMHDMDPIYGRPTLLKWAVYAFTNLRRRWSVGSDISAESLFAKMHNISLDKQFDVKSYFQKYDTDIYFKDWRTGKYYKIEEIDSFVDEDGTFKVLRSSKEVDQNTGEVKDSIHSRVDEMTAETLYDLDQVFGGAWTMSFDQDYNRFIDADHNLNVVLDIIINEDFKDKFIAYFVNKSAVKVGAGNINSNSSWNTNDNTPLMTISMKTKYGGVQMDADHELDESHVTEMTQMLSALEQNAYTHDLATSIYTSIGDIVSESMINFRKALDENDRQKVYVLLGRALVESFQTGEKETLGLAQAFIQKAEKSLQDSKLEYKLPFSAETINGKFVATVTSMLVKRGIRRKYAGIAGVIAPAHGMMQFYTHNGTNYDFNEMAEIVANSEIENDVNEYGDITKSAWEKATTEFRFPVLDENGDQLIDENGFPVWKANPFMKKIPQNEIDFEDYIVVVDKETGLPALDEKGNELSGKVVNWNSYDNFKNVLSKDRYNFFVWTVKPKSLKGSDTKFSLAILGENGYPTTKRFSVYDLDSVRASLYLVDKEISIEKRAIIERVLGKPIGNTSREGLKKELQGITQEILFRISEGLPIPASASFGISANENGEFLPYDVKVIPAEMILGKMNAEAFGLEPGDTISKVEKLGSKFFFDRLQSRYVLPDVDKTLFDVTLFTGSGKKVLVKIGNKKEIVNQFPGISLSKQGLNFTTVDGDVYYDDTYLCNKDGKDFATYTDENGEQFDIIILSEPSRLGELKKSQLFDAYKFNFTAQNWKVLADYKFEGKLAKGENISLQFRDPKMGFSSRPFDLNDPEIYNYLQQDEIISFDRHLKDLSTHKFDSFEKSLNFVGARIPSQGMQSFQPLRVVAFTDSETNDVYVNAQQLWLQGSDLDIDKLYIMGYSINPNGGFQTMSRLQTDFAIDDVLRLPKPNGIRYSEGEDGTIVSLNDLNEVTKDLRKRGDTEKRIANLRSFETVMKSEGNLITFEQPVNATQEELQQFNTRKKQYLRYLNKHTTTELSSQATDSALKNDVVDGILRTVLDPKNQINLTMPISMTEQQDAAARSDLGTAERLMTSDNPATKYIMQVQNMVGKQVIGSVAVSLKVFFGVSNYYNTQYRRLPEMLQSGNTNDAITLLSRLVVESPFENKIKGVTSKKLGVIANLDFIPIINSVKDLLGEDGKIFFDPTLIDIENNVLKEYVDQGSLNLVKLLEDLQLVSNSVDSALSISGLLSAATDENILRRSQKDLDI